MTDKERLDAQKHAIQLIAYFLGKSDVNSVVYGHIPSYHRKKNLDQMTS